MGLQCTILDVKSSPLQQGNHNGLARETPFLRSISQLQSARLDTVVIQQYGSTVCVHTDQYSIRSSPRTTPVQWWTNDPTSTECKQVDKRLDCFFEN